MPRRSALRKVGGAPMAPPPSFIWTRRIALTLLTIFAVTPVYVMISSSLKPLSDVTGVFQWIPAHITVSPYIDMWRTVPLAHYFLNSVIVCTSAAALSVVSVPVVAGFLLMQRFLVTGLTAGAVKQ